MGYGEHDACHPYPLDFGLVDRPAHAMRTEFGHLFQKMLRLGANRPGAALLWGNAS